MILLGSRQLWPDILCSGRHVQRREGICGIEGEATSSQACLSTGSWGGDQGVLLELCKSGFRDTRGGVEDPVGDVHHGIPHGLGTRICCAEVGQECSGGTVGVMAEVQDSLGNADGFVLLQVPKNKVVAEGILLNHAKFDAAIEQEGDL